MSSSNAKQSTQLDPTAEVEEGLERLGIDAETATEMASDAKTFATGADDSLGDASDSDGDDPAEDAEIEELVEELLGEDGDEDDGDDAEVDAEVPAF